MRNHLKVEMNNPVWEVLEADADADAVKEFITNRVNKSKTWFRTMVKKQAQIQVSSKQGIRTIDGTCVRYKLGQTRNAYENKGMVKSSIKWHWVFTLQIASGNESPWLLCSLTVDRCAWLVVWWLWMWQVYGCVNFMVAMFAGCGVFREPVASADVTIPHKRFMRIWAGNK